MTENLKNDFKIYCVNILTKKKVIQQCCTQTPLLITISKLEGSFSLCSAYLHPQAQRVEHNEEEHEVLKV